VDANEKGVDQTTVDAEHNRTRVTFERSLYPLDAIYGAAYVFIDKCYVLLDVTDETHVQVELRGREPFSEDELAALAGEFGNELLSQAWRREITEYNKPIIEAVAAQALAGATGTASLDDLAGDMDFSDDAFEDPLGIAMSWEEKYGKKDEAEPPKVGEPKGPPPAGTDDDDQAAGA
jgi:His-Xaa-Ser system protein HxsD